MAPVRYSETALRQIHEYLDKIDDQMVALAASVEISRELQKLAADPAGLGTAPTGPFETRPVYKFLLHADRRHSAQVSYRIVAPGEIDILLFSSTLI